MSFEFNLINLILFLNTLFIWDAMFAPWILINETTDIDTDCTVYKGDNFGLFFSSVCGDDFIVGNSKLNIIKWMNFVVAVITTVVFVVANWHQINFDFHRADRIMLLMASIVSLIMMITLFVIWSKTNIDVFQELSSSVISYYGIGKILYIVSMIHWGIIFAWGLTTLFLEYTQ